MWAIHVILSLRVYRRTASLAVLRHVEVEEVVPSLRHAIPHVALLLLCSHPAIAMFLGYLRAEVILEVLDVERISQFSQLLAAIVLSEVLVRVDREIEVDVLKIEQVAEVLVGRSPHGVELVVGTRPSWTAGIVHGMRKGSRWPRLKEGSGLKSPSRSEGFARWWG
jgi:hypothetical protein